MLFTCNGRCFLKSRTLNHDISFVCVCYDGECARPRQALTDPDKHCHFKVVVETQNASERSCRRPSKASGKCRRAQRILLLSFVPQDIHFRLLLRQSCPQGDLKRCLFKGAVSPRFNATWKSNKGVGPNWKSTHSCLTFLKRTVLVMEVV